MTTISATMPMPAETPRRGIALRRVLRSEWIKLSTTRSSYLLFGMIAFLIVGVWALAAIGFNADPAGGDPAGGLALALDPYSIGLTTSVGLAQLAAGVLGVVFVTSEYSSGMVRATFAAVPSRITVLLAKTVVLGFAVLAVAILALFAAFFLGGAILTAPGQAHSLSDPDMLRALLGGGVYLAGIAILGASLGWLVRSAAGAIGIFVALVILLPILLPLIPLDAVQTIADYLPSTVGQEMFRLPGLFDDLAGSTTGPWTGLALFAGYALIGLAAAAVALRRRDA